MYVYFLPSQTTEWIVMFSSTAFIPAAIRASRQFPNSVTFTFERDSVLSCPSPYTCSRKLPSKQVMPTDLDSLARGEASCASLHCHIKAREGFCRVSSCIAPSWRNLHLLSTRNLQSSTGNIDIQSLSPWQHSFPSNHLFPVFARLFQNVPRSLCQLFFADTTSPGPRHYL